MSTIPHNFAMYAVNMCTTICLYQVSVKTGLQPNHEVDMIMTGVMLHNITISIWLVNFMVFNATFNDISVISWRSALLVKKSLVPRENPPNASH